ncbi:response regulator [Larkinella soli]|uniref:response regulator n=1 Tax=Larkinella soli TaxID=1770527 RepID=UPI000FFC0B92|nr:response regulator [Larkinella soli]
MNKSGPIIVIEDDDDDQLLLQLVFKKLGHPNKVIFFSDGEVALDYLNQMHDVPFLILSDINMPKLDGFALRNKIHTDSQLSIKCIPYLFFSTAADQRMVVDAYSLSAQGFFIKQTNYKELEETMSIIIE